MVTDRTEEFESFEPPDRPTAPVDISGFIEEARKEEARPPPPPPPAHAKRPSKPELPAAVRKPTKGELPAAPAATPKSSGNTPVPPRKATKGELPASNPSAPAAGSPASSPRSSGNTPLPPRKSTKGELPATSKPARPATPKAPDAGEEVTEAAGRERSATDKDKLVTTNPQMKSLDQKNRRFAVAVVGACALVVGAVIVGAYFVLANDRPEESDLRLVYPYGFHGKRGPKGEVAPGANDVQFKLVGEVPSCGSDHGKCLRYRYTGEGGFAGSMLVGKSRDKMWERVGDEGMPFQPAKDEGP